MTDERFDLYRCWKPASPGTMDLCQSPRWERPVVNDLRPAPHDAPPIGRGRLVTVRFHGQLVECGTIGVLAEALNRSCQTIRLWESQGLLPLRHCG